MNYLQFFKSYYKKSLWHSYVYTVIFYAATIFSFILVFYSAAISVMHLATLTSLSNSAFRSADSAGQIPQIVNPYDKDIYDLRMLFTTGGSGVSSFPIYTAIISAASSAIIGLISFFYVKEKSLNGLKRTAALAYQKELYELGIEKYSDETTKDKVLYEQAVKITGFISIEATRTK